MAGIDIKALGDMLGLIRIEQTRHDSEFKALVQRIDQQNANFAELFGKLLEVVIGLKKQVASLELDQICKERPTMTELIMLGKKK